MDKRKQFAEAIDNLMREEGLRAVEGYLTAQSGLPHSGVNRDLAAGFADYFAAGADLDLWLAVWAWARFGPDEVPGDEPLEFLPFCALQAFGAVYGRCDPVVMGEIFNLFSDAAEDPRRHVRDAAVIGLQRAAQQRFDDVFVLFRKWVQVGTPFYYRAVVATLADPQLLGKPEQAQSALWLAERVLHRIAHLPSEARQTMEFHALVQSMGAALVALALALPEEGFALMANWAAYGDRDISRIIRENLASSRLVETHPQRVAALRRMVQHG